MQLAIRLLGSIAALAAYAAIARAVLGLEASYWTVLLGTVAARAFIHGSVSPPRGG